LKYRTPQLMNQMLPPQSGNLVSATAIMFRGNHRSFKMRTLAIGLIAAAGLALAVPAAQADDVHVGVGVNGLHVGVGDRDHDRREWRHHYARERDVIVHRDHRHCRVTVIHKDGMTKRIKRCD
jgi:hypothetical protein